MTDLGAMVERLYEAVSWQTVPSPITEKDLSNMVVEAIADLYVMTGRAGAIDGTSFQYDPIDKDRIVGFDGDLMTDEKEYVHIVAQQNFFRRVRTDVNTATGYSTDAQSITGADKGFLYLSRTLEELEERRKTIYHKMIRFTL